jgi:hypothetical protein
MADWEGSFAVYIAVLVRPRLEPSSTELTRGRIVNKSIVLPGSIRNSRSVIGASGEMVALICGVDVGSAETLMRGRLAGDCV